MKLKDRMRIALQVLFKGTCKELKDAELAKEAAEHSARSFEQALRMIDDDRPAILAAGNVVQHIRLSDVDILLRTPLNRYEQPSIHGKMHLYSLENIGSNFMVSEMGHNQRVLEYYKYTASVEIGKALIREGLLKMEVLHSPENIDLKTLRFSVPYYRLQK